MGGSLGPQTDDPEFVNNPRHEFNFWFDPEAAQIVLRAPWKKIVCTPTDISIKTRLTPAMIKQIDASGTPLAHYVARYFRTGQGGEYMWDELAAAAWIDPSLITRHETRYMAVDLDRGAGYGNTLTWTEKDKPKIAAQPVEVQVDLDTEKFYRMFVGLMSAPRPLAEKIFNRKGRKGAAKCAKNFFAHFAVPLRPLRLRCSYCGGEPGPRSVYTNCRLSRRSRSMSSSFFSISGYKVEVPVQPWLFLPSACKPAPTGNALPQVRD